MGGTARSIGLLFAWVLIWGIGGSLIDAALTFAFWTIPWVAAGYGFWRRLGGQPNPKD